MTVVMATNVVLIGILTIGTVTGLRKGLIRQVIELIGVIGSFFIAIFFSGGMAFMLQERLGIPYSPALVVGFIVLLVLGMIVFHFFAILIQKFVNMTFLGWVDRFCGAALGMIVALLVSSLLVSAVLELPVKEATRRSVERAEMSLFVKPIAPWLFDAVFHHGRNGVAYEEIFRNGEPI
ncbi:MAG: CvpA family protein [Candidatus Krumholzibacteriota bacterium]|nr:CvpA family protein [Candidatus Krumholzibacteriota bacterium]